jgi:hypothetical protein
MVQVFSLPHNASLLSSPQCKSSLFPTMQVFSLTHNASLLSSHNASLLSSPQFLEQIWSSDSLLYYQYLSSKCKAVVPVKHT